MKAWNKIPFLALLSLLAVVPFATAATHTVMQVGFTFEPDELTIFTGDTVEWVWTSGSHTVTNGTGPADPDAGTLFDDPLTSGNPVVTYTFTESGDVPYFCRPHFGLGMTGVIHVVDHPSSIPTLSEWGLIILGLLLLLTGALVIVRRQRNVFAS